MIGGLADLVGLRAALATIAVLLAALIIMAASLLPARRPDAANRAAAGDMPPTLRPVRSVAGTGQESPLAVR